MKTKFYFQCILPWLIALGPSTSCTLAQSISVTVNNAPVAFVSAKPIQKNSAVLVPLRGVFQALGATVQYDSASKAIVATEGKTVVSLTVGSRTALVNGQKELLQQPSETINGTTLVPLRFVAEAFGATVQWDSTNQEVAIETPETHLMTLPPPTPIASGGDDRLEVVGQLTGVFTNTVPEQVTVRINGVNTVVPITSATIFTVRCNGAPDTGADINDFEIGDQVRVHLAGNGTAESIVAVYGEIIGTVKSITQSADGSYVVTLNDGSTVQMISGAEITMAGRTIDYSDIIAPERVRIRTDQSNRVGYSLSVITGDRLDGVGMGDNIPQQGTSNVQVIPAVDQAMTIASESPASGSVIDSSRPVIYALIKGGDSSQTVSPSVSLLFDGNDVTKSATIMPQFVTYQPSAPLNSGPHTVRLTINDSAGNSWVRQWSFVSAAHNPISSFTSDRQGKVLMLHQGDSATLTLVAQPGGTAFATVGGLRLPLAEAEPGVYQGQLTATSIGLSNEPVTAHFTTSDNSDMTMDLGQTVTVDAGLPKQPKIVSPTVGQYVGTTVQVAGESAPGSVINVSIGYSAKAMGLFEICGTAAQTQAIADNKGRWRTDKLAVATPALLASSRDTALTITATAIDSLGQHSMPSTVKVLLQ